MGSNQIIFPEVNRAGIVLNDMDTRPLAPNQIRVKTAISTISNGTEKANITGDLNIGISGAPPTEAHFPRGLGYSSSGTVVEVGKDVAELKAGDRVAMYGTFHSEYNVVAASHAVRLEDGISFEEGALFYISTFPLAAIRKTQLEIGESKLVMGLGTLGLIAVAFARAAGAAPVIAVDPVAERRKKALRFGADYALDPFQNGFSDEVRRLTGGGAHTAIEVTGLGSGLDSCLDCMAPFGRVALLGCTRDKAFGIDYYRKVHGPGITLIGAHTLARPKHESHPHYFTHTDDMKATMRLIRYGRLDLISMIDETHSPKDCEAVYTRLINDKTFPTVVQFDWTRL